MDLLEKQKILPTKALFVIQIFCTLSFSVLYSTLVLYLTKKLDFPDDLAMRTTASFIAFYYALHLLGGYLGGRFLSFRNLFAIGMIFQVVGCLVIAHQLETYLFWGLAIFLSGAGLNVTCVNCMLTQLFEAHSKHRERAFLLNYSGMNIGFLIGFTLSGFLEISQSYKLLFLISAFGNISALIVHMLSFKKLGDRGTHLITTSKRKKRWFALLGFVIILSMVFALQYFLKNASFSNNLILFIGIIMALFVLSQALIQNSKEASRKLFAYLILALGSLMFFSLYELAPMALTLFISRNVDRHILGFLIQPQWVMNLNSIVIVVGGPLFSFIYKKLRDRGYTVSIPFQFSIALLLVGLAFLALPVGIHFSDSSGMVNFGYVTVCYLLQSLGELFISPIGYAMVGQLVPVKLRGVLMGVWMMIVGIAAAIANIFSTMALSGAKNISPIESNSNFSQTFLFLGLGAIIGALLMSFLIPFLNRLIQEKESKEAPPSVLYDVAKEDKL